MTTTDPATILLIHDDLDAGLKFTHIALNSKRKKNASKYRAKARERYDRALASIRVAEPFADQSTAEMRVEALRIKSKLQWLSEDLRNLGEAV